MKQSFFQCKYCQRLFKTESGLFNHKCEQRARNVEIKTVDGLAGWEYYKKWLQSGHKLVPPMDSFLKSRFYRSFIRFGKFVKKVNLPDVDYFIELMVKQEINPTLWCTDDVYTYYINHLDLENNWLKEVNVTVDTILKTVDGSDCEVRDFFEIIEPNVVIEMIRKRQLSPWVLLMSNQFKSNVSTKFNKQQMKILSTLIDSAVWKKRLSTDKDRTESIKMVVNELGL